MNKTLDENTLLRIIKSSSANAISIFRQGGTELKNKSPDEILNIPHAIDYLRDWSCTLCRAYCKKY